MAVKKILVTGGAGYIGSHVVRQLGARGHAVTVLDNLSTGFAEAVLEGELIVGDTSDSQLVERILVEREIDTVLHFAAHIVVPESLEQPLRYYGNNTCASRNLLACCQRAGVGRFIFSSTAAVYGEPEQPLIAEDCPTIPINPYGRSKLMTEWMLGDLAAASDLRYVALRYFNVAGADPEGRIGQSTPMATHLIKVASELVTGQRQQMAIFGSDYPTPDGTCIRDYIHVDDLADAHVRAVDYLADGGASVTMNCGYGHGYSVREVVAAMERVTGQPLNAVDAPRRPGDPPALIADSNKIRRLLGWQPQFDRLDYIVETALRWQQQLAARDG